MTDPAFRSRVCDCIGDCNDNYEVSVDELVLLVNIVLGSSSVSPCPLGDVNGDGKITVDEILQAVNNLLSECPAPNQTPTPPVLPHGHTCCECPSGVCSDSAWAEVEPVCPLDCDTFPNAECEAPCHGGPQSGSAVCVPLTPCTADSDCDDGNPCTLDHCTINGCTHSCLCV